MNRLTVLQRTIDKIDAKIYLEIGIREGKIISQLTVPHKIGVDPKFVYSIRVRFRKLFGLTKFKAIKVESDTFFQKYASKILTHGVDVAFIDGLHTYSQSLRDVKNCLNYLNEGGAIVLHDCNPLNYAGAYPVKKSRSEVEKLAQKGEIPGWNNAWNGDVWKTIAHLRIENNDLNIFTLDLDWGLGIISTGKSEKLKGFTVQEIQEADYSFFEKNRIALLNLKHPKYFNEFLSS